MAEERLKVATVAAEQVASSLVKGQNLFVFGSFTEQEAREILKRVILRENLELLQAEECGDVGNGSMKQGEENEWTAKDKDSEQGSVVGLDERESAQRNAKEDSADKVEGNSAGKTTAQVSWAAVAGKMKSQAQSPTATVSATLTSSTCSAPNPEVSGESTDEDIEDVSSQQNHPLRNSRRISELATIEVKTGKDFVERMLQIAGNETIDETLKESFPTLRGMTNLGNTCFLNAVVQCLLSTPSLSSLWCKLLDIVGKFETKGETAFMKTTPILKELALLSVELMGSPETQTAILKSRASGGEGDSTVRPDYFINQVRGFFVSQGLEDKVSVNQASSEFQVVVNAPQQDAHEFLEWLLDALDEEQKDLYDATLCTETVNRKLSNGGGPEHGADKQSERDDEWLEVGRKGKGSAKTQRVGNLRGANSDRKTFISESFQGVLRSSVRTQGVKESVTLQPFMCLQLEVLNNTVKTIQDAFELYMAPEVLTGLKPNHGGEEQRGQKQLLFEHLPPALILHLKRFVYDQRTGNPKKLRKVVNYPTELVIPESFLSSKLKAELQIQEGLGNGSAKFFRHYELHAVCLHLGDLAVRGHYTACVCNPHTKDWMEIDDNQVRSVGVKNVLDDPDAYLLYYHRKREIDN